MSARLLSTTDIFWVLLLVVVPFYVWRRLHTLQSRNPPEVRSVMIVVLGDIGRSPRMMYHAESFAKAGYETTLVGYRGTTPPPSLLSAPGVQLRYLSPPPRLPARLFLFLAPAKVLAQVVSLLYAILRRKWPNRPPQYILVQNPPSIPTLAVVQFAAWITGSKVIIDWHNLGYSVLALKLGERHVLVWISAWIEKTFGRRAFAHLFVTNALKTHLVNRWNLQGKIVVLHDRPPARFHATSATEEHELFLRIPELVPPLGRFCPSPAPKSNMTIRTMLSSNFEPTGGGFASELAAVASLRPDRPALAISSTSWTADEDFGILIDALRAYELKARIGDSSLQLPKLLVMVTGKGPLRQQYMERVLALEREETWEWVRCRSLWVEASDYPLLLGSADLGISLHASSSALDLPMKVVDMFGCGLPVCALNFACIDELVTNGENGLLFQDAEQLAGQLEGLLSNFPKSQELSRLAANVRRSRHTDSSIKWLTWEENWAETMKPLLESR